MLNLTRVRVFHEVARHRSFSRAAEELGYTPSAVSHQIATLERELGTPLVNRGVRPWTLTTAGERLYESAGSALSELAAAEHELAVMSSGAAGSLRLCSVASGLRSVVPPAVAAFKSRHPNVDLHLAEGQPTSILRQLRAGEVDIGIIATRHGQAPPRSRSLSVAMLVEQTLMIAVATTSPLAKSSQLTLRQLREESWLLPTRDHRVSEFRNELDMLFEQAGYAPRVMLELDDEIAAQAVIAAGLGIGLIPRLAAPAEHKGVTRIPLRPTRVRALHVVTSAGPVSQPLRTLVTDLKRAATRVSAPASNRTQSGVKRSRSTVDG
jgi:DNA-binding transcriptional LysR family regulator